MATGATPRRIALHVGGGYVPGLHTVLAGVSMAAHELGWNVLAIRDGFDSLLWPERYPAGALVKLTPALVQDPEAADGLVLGGAGGADPFRVQTVDRHGYLEELDRSDVIVETIRAARVDAVVSVGDRHGLAIAHRLHRKGLEVSCVPTSIEHDVAAAAPPLGFDTALSVATELLDRARRSPGSAPCTIVAEILGEHAGWLALQAGLAVLADAVLIPEIPYDLRKVAARLRAREKAGANALLVVVAEGAAAARARPDPGGPRVPDPLRASLAPLACGPEDAHAIFRSGQAAETVARDLQRLTDRETLPLALGSLVRGGAATATDRRLGLAYGAGAVRAVERERYGVMVSLQPRELEFVPLSAAVDRVCTVPERSVFLEAARAVGISLGD